MNSYNSSLTNTYSDRHPAPLSRSEHPAISKENRPVSESVREGQQLRGEIINRTTTDVTIRLSNGQTLQARLDVSVPLSIGQTASFEVTHADPALISLRILQNESAFAQNALIQKALTAAELPVTSRNAELVNTLLQHNLPISKESIQSLIRQSNAYPNADINTLALLTQHKLPVTQATLTQFDAYQNYEHQILPQLENLARSLSELATSSDSSLSAFAKTLQNLINSTSMPESATHDLIPSTFADAASPDTLTPTNTDTVSQNLLHSTAATHAESQTTSASLAATIHNQASAQIAPQSVSADVLPDLLPHTETASTASASTTEALISNANNAAANLKPTIENPTPARFTAVASSDALLSAENALTDTIASPDSLTNTVQQQFPISENIQISSQENFVHQLLTRWTLSPKDLADPGKVKEFYQQLREDLAELHSILRSTRSKETPDSPLERLLSDTAGAAERLQDNLEFMNMLNRIFPYVQLPIRFSDKTAHGELYVYTKKEKLRHEGGSVSVLLHLDMDALGPTDIYLSLTGNSLSSRFYLNDPEQESLFTEHLPELKETLASKGFDTSFELISRRQEEDPVREFLNNHDASGLSRFTFDCRA